MILDSLKIENRIVVCPECRGNEEIFSEISMQFVTCPKCDGFGRMRVKFEKLKIKRNYEEGKMKDDYCNQPLTQ